jgi:hypothetical protein
VKDRRELSALSATPLDVDEDRFVTTWVEAWLRVAQSVVND